MLLIFRSVPAGPSQQQRVDTADLELVRVLAADADPESQSARGDFGAKAC